MPVPSLAYPVVPTGAQVASATPMHATIVALFADAMNHFAGVRFRRKFVSIRSGTDAVENYGYPPVPAGNTELRVVCSLSPLAERLFIVIGYAAIDDTVGTNPELRARIDTLAGAAVDIGCQWRRADGTLTIKEAELIANATRRGAPIAVDTTTRTDDAAAGGAARTAPRMLYVAGSAGTRVDLVVNGMNLVVLSVSAFEYWEREVP